jgi:hypothetical protein
LRLDIGFSINPPSNVNDWFQVYISIGELILDREAAGHGAVFHVTGKLN